MECEQNPPYLVQIDPWGKRVDNVGKFNQMRI